jgi:glyoxylase-like metal-dependent hydrolase (beta-lactamase superfamily II)
MQTNWPDKAGWPGKKWSRTMLAALAGAAATVLVALGFVVQAQPPQGGRGAKGKGGGQPVQPIREVKPGFYFVAGAGANSGVRVTNAGVILVDGKLPGGRNYEDLMAQIKSVTNQPVKYLIVTHHHQDHTGNNQRFLDAGIPIIAHEDLNKELLTYQAKPLPASATMTYQDEFTVRLGGAEADVHHFAGAHTGGDSVVYFPDLKIVMVSDEVTEGRGPLIDYAGGGSAMGFLKALDGILSLDFDTAIPGNGNHMTKAQVAEFRTKFQTVIDRATALIKSGVPKDQLLARIKTDDIGWSLRIPQVDAFYNELSKSGNAATHVPAAAIQATLAKAPAGRVSDQQIRVVNVGKVNVGVGVVNRPAGSAQSAIEHDQLTEVYHILKGSGTLVTGGTLENAKREPADSVVVRELNGPSMRGTALLNGQSMHVAPGDVVIIPAGVGHWFTRVEGAGISYLVVRVDADKLLGPK